MRCRTIQPQLLDFSGGRLNPRLTRAVEAHLQGCAACRRVLRQEAQTASLLGSLARQEPRADAWLAVADALHTSVARRRPSLMRHPIVWLGSATAAAALALSLIAPAGRDPVPLPDPEALWALRPSAAAGLAADRSRDPLQGVQSQVDRFLDGLAEQGS